MPASNQETNFRNFKKVETALKAKLPKVNFCTPFYATIKKTNLIEYYCDECHPEFFIFTYPSYKGAGKATANNPKIDNYLKVEPFPAGTVKISYESLLTRELFIVEVPYNSITEGVDVIINAIEEENKKFTGDTYSPFNIANLDDEEEERTLIVGPGFYSYAKKSVYKSSLDKHVDGGLDAIEEFYREGLMLGLKKESANLMQFIEAKYKEFKT